MLKPRPWGWRCSAPGTSRAVSKSSESTRIATYLVVRVMAAAGGVVWVRFKTRIDPGCVGAGPVIDILVIAVIGGLSHPIGAVAGALTFVLIDTFAVDLIPAARDRFNLIIGTFFLLVVLFSPDGLIGTSRRLTLARPGRRARS